MSKLDLSNMHIKLIIAGLAGLVEDDGLSAREALQTLDEIKQQTWSALRQMEIEKKEGSKA